MAERIVSPGVFTRENDLSYLPQGIGAIGAAFIGPFKQGPAFVPTVVSGQAEFQEIFGTPDGTYYTEYAVQNYLREAGTATIIRTMGIEGYTQEAPVGITYDGTLVATLHRTFEGGATGSVSPDFPSADVVNLQSGSFTITVDGETPTTSSLFASSGNSIVDIFGTSAKGTNDAYVYTYFQNEALDILENTEGTGSVADLVLSNQKFDHEASVASTPWVMSQLISGQRYSLFRIHTLAHGNIENRRFKVGIANVKAAGTGSGTEYATFSVVVRRFDDTDNRKVVLEQFNNVNLDPSSQNYLPRVIGDRYLISDPNVAGKVIEYGDWINRSKYIRVEIAEDGSFPITAAPFGHGAYTNPIYVGGDETIVPAVVYQTTSAANTTASPVAYSGINLETNGTKQGNLNYLNPLPSGSVVGANENFGFETVNYHMTGSAQEDMVKRQFVLAFQGGFDGMNPAIPIYLGDNITSRNSQGFDLRLDKDGYNAYERGIRALSNADEYDINMLVTPGVIRNAHSEITTMALAMVEARQDCFYIADFNPINATIADAVREAEQVDSNYVGVYYPWMKMFDTRTNKLISVPPSVMMPATYAANDAIAAEWFAPAGLNRGGIGGAVNVLNRLTHSERDTLYENKVNPIASFPGQGIVAYGQKTLQDKPSALDRINVRRLLIKVKKYIASTSRYLLFENNTSSTRNKFINTVQPYLESIQQRQGLYAFKVVMDETNNTPDIIDRNIMAGQIFLQPTKTAEFIIIDFNILPTGAAFSA